MSTSETHRLRKALRFAAPKTLPVLAGYLFLGLSYGIYMNTSGFAWWYPPLMAFFIYGGSLEFLAVGLLLSKFAPLETFLLALVVQMRHLFYGISMLEKYKGTGWKKFQLIYDLSDETFAVNYSLDIPKDVDKGWVYYLVSILDKSYWGLGALLGGLLGKALPFNTEGLDFVMTALFLTIFLDQWKKQDKHWSSLIGVGVSVLCLALFGADNFLLPTMAVILLLLTVFRNKLEVAS